MPCPVCHLLYCVCTEEYAYAGHPLDDTGVYEMTPRREEEVCSSVKFRYDIYSYGFCVQWEILKFVKSE